MASITELKWQTLTGVINDIKSPNQFLKRFLWGQHQSLSTEDIELSLLTRGREIAPFVKKNGEGLMVPGHAETFQTVSPANIRIKKPFTPSELLYNRRPGTVIFPTTGQQVSALRAHISRDLQGMADMITNAEEYLCSLALTGTITYEVADEEVFTVSFPRPAETIIDLMAGNYWDGDPDMDTITPLQDIHAIKRIMSDQTGLAPTDCILGTEAADALLSLVEGGNVQMLGQAGLQVAAGDITFVEQFRNDGVIFLGRLGGVRFWEYGRTADLDGTPVDMIRPKYGEFVSTSRASERVLYYGAIPDYAALNGRRFVGERFSKAWETPDPSSWISLTHSRPLPVPRRANAWVSAKLVSG